MVVVIGVGLGVRLCLVHDIGMGVLLDLLVGVGMDIPYVPSKWKRFQN